MEDTEWIIVVARGNTCCSLYKRVLQGSKTGGVVTYGGSTKRVWCQCIGHRKVDVSDKNETLQGDFSGGGRGLMWWKMKVPRLSPKFIVW